MSGVVLALVGSIGHLRAAARSLCGTVSRGPLAEAAEAPRASPARTAAHTLRINLRPTALHPIRSQGPGECQGDDAARAALAEGGGAGRQRRAGRPDVVDQERLTR